MRKSENEELRKFAGGDSRSARPDRVRRAALGWRDRGGVDSRWRTGWIGQCASQEESMAKDILGADSDV